jgi:hypothetical protein
MKAALLVLLGAIIAWLAADALRGDPLPDSRVPELQAAVDSARRIARTARAERDSVERALADSTEAWRQSRGNLQAIASTAREEADSIARHLTAALDTTGARLLTDLRAAHRREVLAVSEERDSWKAETLALRSARETDARLITALSAQVADLEALDRERVRVNEGLRAALARERTKGRITLAIAVVGAAVAVLR